MNHFFKHIRSRRSARESEVPSDDQGIKGDSEKNRAITEKLNKFLALVCTVEKSWEVPMLESSFVRDSMNVSESDGTTDGTN